MGWWCVAATSLIASCYSPVIHTGSPCTTDDQCPKELACINGTCGGAAPADSPPPTDSIQRVDATNLDAPRPPDAFVPLDASPAACANHDLGSSLGAVATDTTVGHMDTYMSCNGKGSPDVSYAWKAPATANFTMDLCSSATSFDSVLYVRDGTCTGAELACDDDGCGASLLSRLRINLTAGQLVIIIVDGFGDSGAYTLTITQN
jgi:hypothetical protein